MHAQEILYRITRPFVLAGIYKDDKSALIDITLDYINRKIERYDHTISKFQEKYGCDFGQFSERIQNNATIEAEEDWMEWKGAWEMRQAWLNANKMLVSHE